MDPLVLTYDNKPTENTQFFLQTLERNGWTAQCVGVGEEWAGFVSKIRGYRTALESVPAQQLVVLADARDVVCLRQPRAFADAFASFGAPIVASMELFCGGKFDVDEDFKHPKCRPLHAYWKHHGRTTPPLRKFVNSGLLAGTAHALYTMLDWILAHKFVDDQFAVGSYMCAFPDRVAADHEAALLHTSTFAVNAGIQSIHVQKHDSPTFAELFGRGAFFLHIPGLSGTGQACMYEFVKHALAHGAHDETLRAPYKYDVPAWDEKF